MESENIGKLVEQIDALITETIEARPQTVQKTVFMQDVRFEEILGGDYPSSDPSSVARRALMAIGTTLGLVGGPNLMKRVFNAYQDAHGLRRATKLDQQWYGAAGMWG